MVKMPVAYNKFFSYNNTMMSCKRFFTCITLLLFLSFCAVASSVFVDSRPSLNVAFGGAFTIPTASYLKEYPGQSSVEMPPVRTSYGYNFDLRLLSIGLGNEDSSRMVNLGAGVSFTGISRSLAFGSSVLKAYNGAGVFFSLGTAFGTKVNIDLATKFFVFNLKGTSNSFFAGEIETIPSFEIAHSKTYKLALAIPVSILFKADSLVFRLSCALKFDYSVRGFRGSEDEK